MKPRPSLLIATFLSTAAVLLSGHSGRAMADEPRTPQTALAGLDVAEGLEATLFASEPMMHSPSNIDVDHLGRVWVMEVLNYRSKKGSRPEGDRLLVLEDSDGDGQADRQSVFYQGTDIDGGMGICVLGNQVIVSASPHIFLFTDDDGDLKADKKELLFTKTGQEQQHDHSAHAFTFGPDGKLYWNFGNTGKHVHDKQGKLVTDIVGNEVIDDGQPYRGGMVFRCNPDGSEFEVLAHNFRNNYEVAVDSFGTLWQSDNDDDGNRGVRINYVMEHGNFGYRDEMTGAGWRTKRIGMHTEIPLRHWHLKDPGVVPNLLQTGAGSPTGIVLYEGRLLPDMFHDQIIHCDAGPNVVRAYPAEKEGAGYTAQSVNILHGARDQWFRPSDVCVAPDGSLIVADWYDPGVGGHRMEDLERGRLFRIAPAGTPYVVVKHDFSTAAGAVAALRSPNLATRYLAWKALDGMGNKAEAELSRMYSESDNPRHRARALWLLGRLPGAAEKYVRQALGDQNPDIRIAGLRLARSVKLDVVLLVGQLLNDPSPQVRRECALALHGLNSPAAAALWASLAMQHNGQDRWYLEALGIGAAGNWDACFDAWMKLVGDQWISDAGHDIVWRSRSTLSARYLAAILLKQLPETELPRYLRAFDFISSAEKNEVLTYLAFRKKPYHPQEMLIAVESLKRLKPFKIAEKPDAVEVFQEVLKRLDRNDDFLLLVDRFDFEPRYADLLTMAAEKPNDELGIAAIRALLRKDAGQLITDALNGDDEKNVANMLQALGNSLNSRTLELIFPVLQDEERSVEIRRQAVSALGKTGPGAKKLLQFVEARQLDAKLKDAAAATLHASADQAVRAQAQKLFPPPPSKDNKPLPPLAQLLKRRGNVSQGKLVFNTTGTCLKCHQVNGVGKEVGPSMTEIGDKLSRQAFFDSILFPSAGISHNYETYVVVQADGTTVNGLITSRTPDEITVKGSDAIARAIKTSDIEEIVKQDISLMPADLQKLMTAEELVNVVEYLTTLKKAKSQ